jgi:hypothetical protein
MTLNLTKKPPTCQVCDTLVVLSQVVNNMVFQVQLVILYQIFASMDISPKYVDKIYPLVKANYVVNVMLG